MEFYLAAVLQGLCFCGIAAGIYISMKIFNIPDITTDGSYTLGAVVTAIMLSHEISWYFILPVVLLAGALAGSITGFIHTKLKISALLSGILVMTALYSVNLKLMGRSNLPSLNYIGLFSGSSLIPSSTGGSLTILVAFIVILGLIIGYVLITDFGLAMRATGNSESMIRALGINSDRMKIIGLAMANALTAVSGFLMAQLQGFTDINMGIGIVIVGLGSVIIGDTAIRRFHITLVWLSLLLVFSGAVIFQLVLAFTLSIGVDPNLLKLVTAVFVLLIVALTQLSFKRND
ncbi:ABC transporter permease [Pedobacter sp. HMF7647]|uniref:ABC transporter permease n=1 Tax=Hufsiella arboris TaxID=2695275 RepID=A0A7K1Y7Z9_9SPHI|nr:ABC transporter permease [Hufsiella arboris]MXV50491.1 ABC transporter permease [Hufsiella arboris]